MSALLLQAIQRVPDFWSYEGNGKTAGWGGHEWLVRQQQGLQDSFAPGIFLEVRGCKDYITLGVVLHQNCACLLFRSTVDKGSRSNCFSTVAFITSQWPSTFRNYWISLFRSAGRLFPLRDSISTMILFHGRTFHFNFYYFISSSNGIPGRPSNFEIAGKVQLRESWLHIGTFTS